MIASSKMNFPLMFAHNYGIDIYLERINPFISFKLRKSHGSNKNFWCDLLGHKWVYRDFTNRINSKGEKYHFTEKRICHRCGASEYHYDKWEEYLHDIDRDFPMP